MKRCSSLHSRAAAATTTAADYAAVDMSYRPSFFDYRLRGGRYPQAGICCSNKPSGPETDGPTAFVSGESHFNSVRDSNRGFRPIDLSAQPSYSVIPPPRQYYPAQQVYGHRPQQGMPIREQFSGRGHMPIGGKGHTSSNHHARWDPHDGAISSVGENKMPQPFMHRPSKLPDYREWERAEPVPPPHLERFTVLSYNILADYLACDPSQQLYYHIPRYMMDWDWRKRNITFELGLWSADILCLQEVDRFHDIEAELKLRGYSGIWKMRTGDRIDGCATFWRVSRFKLVHEESIEYKKLFLRDNVAQISVLESLRGHSNSNDTSVPSTSSGNSNRVVVCNIHVLFNPKRGDIKLGQIRVLLDRAKIVSKIWDDAPIVICGDFNCTPKSPLYNFIAEQKLDFSNLPRDKVSGQTSAEIQPPRPAYPDFRLHSGDISTRVSTANPIESNLTSISEASNNQNGNEIKTSKAMESDVSQLERPDNSPPDEPASCESTSGDFVLDEKFKVLSVNASVNELKDEGNHEDCDSFLSELHSTNHIPSSSDLNCNSHNEKLNSPGEENLNGGQFRHFSSAWSPLEVQTASGSADCKVMEHALKLRSAYTEVKDSLGLRDSSGEPLVTSYNRRFLGTVDYIWLSEGLQASRVLAPIPKHVMQHTPGFPTKKWGSDHIALVSELAFIKDNV